MVVKKKLRILCDMDCIMVEMLPQWIKVYNQRTGENVKLEDIHAWDMSQVVNNYEELAKIIEEPGFFFNLEPMPYACYYISKILEDGHDFVIVTQLPRKADHAAKDKRRWIKKYLHFGKPFDLKNVVFTHRKDLVRGDVFFDDSPMHLESWKKANPKKLTVTIDYPYNKNTKVDHRVTSWKQFYEFISEKSH
jgi:5'-nucleotidase